MFISLILSPSGYFTVKYEQEIDLAPNCNEYYLLQVFLTFLRFEQEGSDPSDQALCFRGVQKITVLY